MFVTECLLGSLDPFFVAGAQYAVLLDSVRHDYDSAESLYCRAIQANPRHAYSLFNYAVLLEDIRRDLDKAELVSRRSWMKPVGGVPHTILTEFASVLRARCSRQPDRRRGVG